MPGLLYSQRADFEHAQYPDHTGKKAVDPDLGGAGKCFLRRRLGFAVVRPPAPLQVTCGLVNMHCCTKGIRSLQVIDPDLTVAGKCSLYT